MYLCKISKKKKKKTGELINEQEVANKKIKSLL